MNLNNRLTKLEDKLKPFIPKSLKVITINPGDNKEEILKQYNRNEILILEYTERIK